MKKGPKPSKIKAMNFCRNVNLLNLPMGRTWQRSERSWADFDPDGYGVRVFLKGNDDYLLLPWPIIDRVVMNGAKPKPASSSADDGAGQARPLPASS